MKPSKHTLSGLLALVAFLWISSPSFAQQNKAELDTSQVYELGEVIISASKYEQSPKSVGRNVTVISESEIRNSIHTSVAGILAEQQSLHVTGNRQTPGSLQNLFLRSTNSNQTVVMVDGARISDPSSTGNEVNLSELSLAGVQRIEIVRGSHSTLYGSSAIGGVINIITKEQSEEALNADLTTQVGRINGGTFSTQNNLSLSGSLDNGLYTNLAVSQQYTNGFDATVDTVSGSGFNPRDRDGFRKLDLFGKLGYKTPVLDVYGSYRRADQRAELDQAVFQDDDNAKQHFDRDLFNYGVSADITDNIELGFEGAYSTLNRNFVNDSSLVDSQGNYDGIYTETMADGTLWNNEVTGTYQTEHATIIAGLESNRQTMSSRNYTYSSSFDFETETDLDSLDLKETINSAYVQTDLSGSLLKENWEALSLVMGARLADHNRFGSHFTYEFNPSVQLSSSALLFAAVTTGFNAPSLYQMHAPNQALGSYTDRGNPNLDPEESVSYELGWKQSIGQNVRFELSLFRTNVDNVIEYVYLWDKNADLSRLSGQDYLGDTYLNGSEQHINGVELGANIQPVSAVSISGNVTYTHSEIVFTPGDIDESYTGGHQVQIYESGVFVNDKKEIDGLTRRPSVSANVQLKYRPTNKWTVGLSSRFVGSRDDIYYSDSLGPYGALDRSKVSGYNLTDVSLRYRLSQHLQLGAQVDNVFDTEYTEIRGYQTRGRGLYFKASFSL